MPERMIVDVRWATGAPYSMTEECRRGDWDMLDPALDGDLSAAHGIPTGSHMARDYPATGRAPAVRIVVGEMPREDVL